MLATDSNYLDTGISKCAGGLSVLRGINRVSLGCRVLDLLGSKIGTRHPIRGRGRGWYATFSTSIVKFTPRSCACFLVWTKHWSVSSIDNAFVAITFREPRNRLDPTLVHLQPRCPP